MPFAWVGAAASAVSAGVQVAGALSGGGAQSGAISDGQAQANARVQPWVDSGTLANTRQSDLLGLNGQPAADTAMSGFQASPGYQYQVSQGLKAVDAGAASKGTLVGGQTIKAEQTLGNNLANQDFGAYLGRLNDLSKTGESAGVNQASTDTSAAGNQASIYGNEAKGLTSAVGGLAGNKDVQNSLTGLFSSGSPTTTTVSNPNVLGGTYQAATTAGDAFY